jgi:hypothetical protein
VLVLALIGGVVEGIVGWDEVQQWIKSPFVSRKEVTWQGHTIGQLVNHIKGEAFSKETKKIDVQLAPSLAREDLDYLLISKTTPRRFQKVSFRDILVKVCRENGTCLVCMWSAGGDTVTLDIRSSCVERLEGGYSLCKRPCDIRKHSP